MMDTKSAQSSAGTSIHSVEAMPIAGIFTVRSRLVSDHRGRFARLFDSEVLAEIHAHRPIVQINHSMTRTVGAVRGMHFQRAPALEAKWVRCLRGRVWDVAVDLRKGSATFLQHVAVELNADDMNAILIPEGCAHGFQVLEPDSELLYLHSAPYTPLSEDGLRWDDPKLAIPWPLAPTEISERDRNHQFLSDEFEGLTL